LNSANSEDKGSTIVTIRSARVSEIYPKGKDIFLKGQIKSNGTVVNRFTDNACDCRVGGKKFFKIKVD
jgi:hypothetical protein